MLTLCWSSPQAVVHMLCFPSVDDQGLESGGLWWNPRPTLHAGESSTVFGHVETESHIKDLNLIMKDCSAFFILFLNFFYKWRREGTTGKNTLCPAIVGGGGSFSFCSQVDLYCNNLG